jgi:hypothetical protein
MLGYQTMWRARLADTSIHSLKIIIIKDHGFILIELLDT